MFQKVLSLLVLLILSSAQSPILISDFIQPSAPSLSQSILTSPQPQSKTLFSQQSSVRTPIQGIWQSLSSSSDSFSTSPLIITPSIIKYKNYQYSYELNGNTIRVKSKQQNKNLNTVRQKVMQDSEGLKESHFWDMLSGVLTFRNMQGKVLVSLKNSGRQ